MLNFTQQTRTMTLILIVNKRHIYVERLSYFYTPSAAAVSRYNYLEGRGVQEVVIYFVSIISI